MWGMGMIHGFVSLPTKVDATMSWTRLARTDCQDACPATCQRFVVGVIGDPHEKLQGLGAFSSPQVV
jgi:hypothetical protein